MTSISGETVNLDGPVLGTLTTPTTFARGSGYAASGQRPYACGIERYYDNYGVLIPPPSNGIAAGDQIFFGFRQHPDAFQIQSISSNSNASNTDLTKPVINGLIQSRTILKGKDLQAQILGGGTTPAGVGTISFDSSGLPTIAVSTMTLQAIDNVAPQAYPVALAGTCYAPDFVNTPAGASQYTYLKLYKLTFSNASGSFAYHLNNWGNIRLLFTSGVLAGKSMRLYSQITTGSTMVAYAIDDLNICGGTFTGAVNDTAQQPLNFTDGSVVTVGTPGSSNWSVDAQSMIITLNPTNPLKPTVHAPLPKFAGQTGLSYSVTQCVFRGLRRAYLYSDYEAVTTGPATQGTLTTPKVGGDFALANFNVVQSTLYSTQSGSVSAQWNWQGVLGSNFIDSFIGSLVISYGNGDRGFYDLGFFNCIGVFPYTPGTNYTPQATTSSNLGNNLYPYVMNIDPVTNKVSSVYFYQASSPSPSSAIPRLSALRYPMDALSNVLALTSPVGATPTLN